MPSPTPVKDAELLQWSERVGAASRLMQCGDEPGRARHFGLAHADTDMSRTRDDSMHRPTVHSTLVRITGHAASCILTVSHSYVVCGRHAMPQGCHR